MIKLMTSYPTKKLGEIIELKYGKGIARVNRSPNGEYPIYGANGILGHSDKYLVESEAIIIGRKGSAGEVARVSGKFWPSDVTYFVLGNEHIDIDYLFHLFKSLNLQKFAVGVKPGINRNRVYEIEILVPPLAEQKKVVAKLEKLLAKVKEVKKLRAEAQENTDNFFSSTLHEIFSSVESKEWKEKTLGSLAKIESGNAFKSEEYSDSGYFLIRIANVQDGSINLNHPKYIPKRVTDKSKKFILNEGDLLMSLTGNVGRVSFILGEHLPAILNQRVARISVLDAQTTDINYLFYFFSSPDFKREIEELGHGMAQLNVSPVKMRNLKILLPPLTEQKKIVARLDALSAKIRTLQEHQTNTAADLEVLEQSILHQAFSGKL